jgi:hypothetical protein
MVTRKRCGNGCGREIRIGVDRWARRKIGGRWRIVCEACAGAIDGQTTLQLLRIKRATRQGRRAA